MPSVAEAPLTKLEAVNEMLRDIGEREVSSLVAPTRSDVIRAIASLDHVSRSTQLQGWWFNDEIVSLSVDGSGYYNIPDDVERLQVISGGPTSGDNGAPRLVVRAGKLYDTVNATDVFVGAEAVKLRIFRLLAFEDLPASARDYIYLAASIRFQSRSLGSQDVDLDLKIAARRARAILLDEEAENVPVDLTLSPRFLKLMHLR